MQSNFVCVNVRKGRLSGLRPPVFTNLDGGLLFMHSCFGVLRSERGREQGRVYKSRGSLGQDLVNPYWGTIGRSVTFCRLDRTDLDLVSIWTLLHPPKLESGSQVRLAWGQRKKSEAGQKGVNQQVCHISRTNTRFFFPPQRAECERAPRTRFSIFLDFWSKVPFPLEKQARTAIRHKIGAFQGSLLTKIHSRKSCLDK